MPRTSGPATRRRILAQAVRAFGRAGYDATSLDDIAAAVGIRKQSLLYHFPTKDDLFTQAAVVAAGRIAAAVGVALRPRPEGMDRVDALVGGIHRLARRRPEVVSLIREASRVGPPLSDRVAEAMRPLVGAATEWLQNAMESGLVRRQNARVAVLTIYSAVIGHLTESSVKRIFLSDVPFEEAEAELVAFLRAALEPSFASVPLG